MAELVGIVSGAAGLASLAIQLGESVVKLKRFYDSVRSAPRDLKCIVSEIETLFPLLIRIECNPPQNMSPVDALFVAHGLKMCRDACNNIGETAITLENSIRRQRMTGAIKTVLKERQIRDSRVKLERAKSNLTILLLAHLAYVLEQQDVQIQQAAAYQIGQQRTERHLMAIASQVAPCISVPALHFKHLEQHLGHHFPLLGRSQYSKAANAGLGDTGLRIAYVSHT
ncbi:hypothetical protein LTR08_003469 [Meristemomyces frigidus]|nr:hypothetical protein LTR08_003469 [Meristemomyces frigidus]